MNLAEMSWEEVGGLSRDTPVVIPVAALEQHGRHLPVFVDSMLLGEVIRRVSEAMQGKVLFAPLTWLGNSHHHMDFPGTLSAEPRLYLDLLENLANNFIDHGFKRIVFINGHGGNIYPGKQAVFELRQKYRDRNDLLLLFSTYWDLAAGNPVEGKNFVQAKMGHACEWETSMILKLAPHLVKKPVASLKKVEFGFAFEPAYRGWITKDRTEPGHIGDPCHATAEKGELLFSTFSKNAVGFLEKVIAWDGSSWF
ncbi:MAG: creatininase family protein [Gemmataceae bacterium]|nr:creatininase family protein [Gemmataceae bacterium]